MFTMLCKYHHYFQNFFITLNRNFATIKQELSIPPSNHILVPLMYYLSLWICLVYIFHLSGIKQCLFFGIWLISLCIMFSRFIHVVAYIRTSFFLWLKKILLYVHTTLCLSIHLLMDTWVVSTFWLLWITLQWTLIIRTLWIPIFSSFGYILRSRIAGSHGNYMFSFFRSYQTIFHSNCTILHSHYQCLRVLISKIIKF